VEWVTTTAKTLPEAIDLALDNLGVDEAEAEIVVLEEPKQGLFGRMRGAARVDQANKQDKQDSRNSRDKSDGRDSGESRDKQNSRSGSDGSGGRQSATAERNAEERNEKSSGSGRSRSRRRRGAGGSSDGQGQSTSVTADTKEQAADRNNRSGSSNADSTRRSGGNNGKSSSRSRPNDREQVREQQRKEDTPVEEVAEHLRTFLGGLTEAFGLESTVEIDNSEADVLVATVQSQHGLMVGPKGRTLDAIQELARVSSQRAAPSNIRIRVDVGGYRQQRAAALGDFASKAADRAVDNGCEVALDPMSPADRKSIHDALVEDPRVETRSVGTEPRRKVIIIPLEDAKAVEDAAEEAGENAAAGAGEEE
jgi:spoIIIJ-associated protein